MEHGRGYLDRTYEIRPLTVIRYVFKHIGIAFWGVSIIPFYISWVFASRSMFANPSSAQQFYDLILGLIIIGPFLGGSTILFNDYWDSEVDKTSRRKAGYPLSKGIISPATVLKLSIVFMVFAIILSLTISIIFTGLVSLCILLSIIYSGLPLRIKSRPGFDLIINATGAGILCSFAGWVLIKPILEYPFFWLIPMFFGVAAFYIPTTIIDYPSDKQNGVNTIAVRMGKKRAFYLGLACIIVANVAVMAMGLKYYLATPGFVYYVWPIALGQVILYYVILRKQTFKNVFRTIIGLAALLTFGNLLLLLHYTDVWKIS